MQGRPVSSRLGWHLLLAMVMLLMQQAGLRHALQHATQDEGGLPHTTCVQCLAHHAHDSSAAPTVPVLALLSFGHELTADTAQPQCGQGKAHAYLSRAPPARLFA